MMPRVKYLVIPTCTRCGRFVRIVFGQAVCQCPNGPTRKDRS